MAAAEENFPGLTQNPGDALGEIEENPKFHGQGFYVRSA